MQHTNPDPLRALPPDLAIPRDTAGPVFAEPWEARAFAVVVDMNARGLFAWKEFQERLVAEIRRSEGAGQCRPYYMSWLAAAESLLEAKGFASDAEIDAEAERLRPDDRTVRLPR
jgi:nitrile hydratase accessory protein